MLQQVGLRIRRLFPASKCRCRDGAQHRARSIGHQLARHFQHLASSAFPCEHAPPTSKEHGDQRELQLLVEAGFTPVEAIRIATANGARYLGRLDRIGTIEAGKQADLVVLKGDPTRRIADVENVEIVFKDGVGYDPVKLNASVRGMVGIR